MDLETTTPARRRGNVEAVARAVLYEGYLLYPYRPSSLKNRHRWTFGVLAPRDQALIAGESWTQQTECLWALNPAGGEAAVRVSARVRFLRVAERDSEASQCPPWQEAAECEVACDWALEELLAGERTARSCFPAVAAAEQAGRQWPVEVEVVASATAVRPEGQGGERCVRMRLVVRNVSELVAGPTPAGAAAAAEAQRQAMLSTHVIVRASAGAFLSLTDPPAEWAAEAAACVNAGAWPVLVGDGDGDGEAGERDAVLSSPVILPDHPRVAAPSPGDLFDGTEIDEILTLRILTMTPAEKAEAAAADGRARALLERTEGLSGEQLMRLHGGRATQNAGSTPGVGDRVRLCPGPGGDLMDLALRGRAAVVEVVEEDLEGRVYLGVTVDDDPGRDLGARGLPGHRFYFRPDEVEVLEPGTLSGGEGGGGT